jgi:lysozyme
VPTLTPSPPATPTGARPLSRGDEGADVRALQRALNDRAAPRRYPAVAVDGRLGPGTWRAWIDIGYALGLRPETLDADAIPVGGQRLVAAPEARSPEQVARARVRAGHLASRSIAMDGTPLFWGLAAPLVEARAHGWTGRVVSGDRRSDVAERFGKKSQAKLWSCYSRKRATGACPAACGGDCLPANPPGRSSHELCSDGVAFQGPVGRELPWWQLGLDVTAADELLAILARLGYRARRPYRTAAEAHHVNFERDPGPVLPAGRHRGSGGVAVKPAPVVVLTGPDVSSFQGDVNWREVRQSGHTFAIVKATEGKDWDDPRFGEARWKAIAAAGLRRGAYHFGRPQAGRPPQVEARHFLAAVKRAGGFAPGDLPPVLDLEWSRGLDPAGLRRWVAAWVATVKDETGVQPMIYTGGPFWHGALGDGADAFGCALWLAAYVRDPTPYVPRPWRGGGYALWQYTDRGRCPGIAGPCDLSRFRGSPAAFRRLGF